MAGLGLLISEVAEFHGQISFYLVLTLTHNQQQ